MEETGDVVAGDDLVEDENQAVEVLGNLLL